MKLMLYHCKSYAYFLVLSAKFYTFSGHVILRLYSYECAGSSLPWWFVYIGWCITIATAVTSSYVTVMYSLTYGRERSIAWTISFFATVIQEDGIIEPTKITIVAAFVTFIVGTRVGPHTPSSYTLNSGWYQFKIDQLLLCGIYHLWIAYQIFLVVNTI